MTTYLNVAVTEIAELHDWPFLLASTTGTSPLTISDLRSIESVSTPSSKLTPIDRRDLSDYATNLSQTGTPNHYYLSSSTQISTYPVGTETLTVRYWKVPTELSAGGDTPVIPTRYHYAIVDYAAARAYADSDNPEAAANARREGERLVGLMMESLLQGQHDRPMSRQAMLTFHGD